MTTTVLILNDTGVQHDLTTSASGSYVSYIPPGSSGTWSWIAELYGFQRQTGTFSPAAGGTININPSWSRDTAITVSVQATVEQYTSINNLDELYDYSCYIRTQDPMHLVLSATAGKIVTEADIVLDGTTTTLWDYDSNTDTLTIGTALLASGTTLVNLETTGEITLVNGAIITSLFSDSSGSSSRLKYTGLVNSTIYLTDNLGDEYELASNKTGSFTQYIPTSATGSWNWVIESYGFNRQTSSVNFTGGDYSVVVAYTPDANITQTNLTTVSNYTEISTLNQLYDYAAYMRTLEPQFVLVTRNGAAVDLGSTNIVIDNLASEVWDYNQSTNTLTIKSTTLSALTRFTTLATTGTITLQNDAKITALYSSSSGPSARLIYTNMIDATILTLNDSGVEYDSQSDIDGVFTNYFTPGQTGLWSWAVERFGYKRQTSTFIPGNGGDTTVTPVWVSDTFITNAVSTSVAAYTTITTLDQLYDYAAYMRTIEPEYVLVNSSGSSMNLGSVNLVLDGTAIEIWSFDPASNTLTIKTSVLSTGIKNTQLITTGLVSFQNTAFMTAVYTDSRGTSTNLTIANIPENSSLYIEDNSGSEVYFNSDVDSSVVVTYISPGQTGNWRWTVEKYGNTRQSFTFTPGGGVQTFSVVSAPDVSITEPNKEVTGAYTILETADKLYDYIAYYRTTSTGIRKDGIASRASFALDLGTRSLVINEDLPTVISVIDSVISIKAPSMSPGVTFTRLITAAPGLITSLNDEPINLKIADALGARATVTGLDPQNFGITWYLRYKLNNQSTYSYLSGTGNGVNLLVANGTYTFEARVPGYEWATMSLDTTNSLDLNINLQYHKASDESPQWLKQFDPISEAIFTYDSVETKVAVNNTTGVLMQANFAEMYQALQRISHLPNLVWVWSNPVRSISATQTIIIPTGNPIAMFLTSQSTASVRITCQIVHAIDGTIAFDRVQGNSSGYAIFLGTSQASEIASLRTDIVADLLVKLGGAGFTTEANSLVTLTNELSAKPTLAEIETSDSLATSDKLEETFKAVKVAIALSA